MGMKTFEVIGARATFNPGSILRLKKEQAEPRLHALNALKNNLYEVVEPVEFKRGECVGYDGDVSKATLADIKELKKAEEEAAAKKKAEEAK